MTACLLEQFIFSKLHFDPQGLIVAAKDDRPVAFGHAGFGPSETPHELDPTLGVTHRVMVDPEVEAGALPTELLALSEQYLISHGAQVLYGGGVRPLDAFYLGLYGGSELPGVLDTDPGMQQLFSQAGYRVIDRIVVLQCDLSRFRAPVTHATRQWVRSTRVEQFAHDEEASWWRRGTIGCLEPQRFELRGRNDELLASTTLWDLEPLASCWGVRAAGILDLQVAEGMRRRGIATHFLSELMRQLRLQGVSIVEAQTMVNNQPALDLYRKLGFVEIDRGAVYRKDSVGRL
jgi:GNAT superfamily N-acetyltransferase